MRGGTPLTPEQKASNTIQSVIQLLGGRDNVNPLSFRIGKIDREFREYATQNGIELAGNDLIMTRKQIAHTLRPSKKDKDKAISEQHLVEFPIRRKRMELYHDNSNKNFIYFDRARNEKFVVHPNYELKIGKQTSRAVNYITASKTNPQEFTLKKFRRIK